MRNKESGGYTEHRENGGLQLRLVQIVQYHLGILRLQKYRDMI